MTPSANFADLEGASVLITGGGSGIGAALTEGFSLQGAMVAFIDISEGPSQSLCDRVEKTCGRRPLFLNCDLRDIEALREAVASAESAHGAITVLINNAAFDDRHAIEDVTEEYWDNNQSINLRPHFFTAQAVAPGMKEAGGGSIINFTSTSFLINHPGMPSYT
ncbi:MAG: SDR family oxidoreductase, partial [Pseudaminobacter sp.]|nr:SDR family oxidoreductase [Pseudaminobacter sp.]